MELKIGQKVIYDGIHGTIAVLDSRHAPLILLSFPTMVGGDGWIAWRGGEGREGRDIKAFYYYVYPEDVMLVKKRKMV